jgi:DNA-binding LytR/AlgR family response regulator
MLKIMLICISATAVLGVYELIKALRQHNDKLIKERKIIQKQVEKFEEDYLNKSISFSSETGSENLKFLVAEVAYIKSADNYVEIFYHEGDGFKKKLLRNTMRGIEQQIKPYSNFVRCHRVCIVNSHFIEHLNKNYGSYSLSIKGHEEKIPVSRQYLLKIKELV